MSCKRFRTQHVGQTIADFFPLDCRVAIVSQSRPSPDSRRKHIKRLPSASFVLPVPLFAPLYTCCPGRPASSSAAMFAASAVLLFTTLSSVVAKPLTFRRANAPALALQAREPVEIASSVSSSDVSFSSFQNITALRGFDDFEGAGNFRGERNQQVVVIQEVQTQCQDVQIQIVQQRLAILREVAKKIVTEHICNVETQTIVLAQHNGHLEVFREDIQRKTTRGIGFDQEIVSKFDQIFSQDGSLSVSDAGFTGIDIGKNLIVPSGNDWDEANSPQRQPSIDAAIEAAVSKSEEKSSSSTSASASAKSTSTA
ncbi:hypothetical protein MKEN_00349600 [Mycena kentingensis (nom. inval.)]|nr:hypothetical protein MKEN_00349600 [Mycena kentingensis (nom. inval.)]